MFCKKTKNFFKRQKRRRKSINRFERPPSYSKVVTSFDPPPSYFGIIGTAVPKTGEEADSLCKSIERKKKRLEDVRNADLCKRKNQCLPVLTPIADSTEESTHMVLTFPHRQNQSSDGGETRRSPFIQTTSFGLSRITEVSNVSRPSSQPPALPKPPVDWRTSLVWMVQYCLKSTLQATISHFQSVFSRALLLRCTTKTPKTIKFSDIDCPKPITLSVHRWVDFISAVGFTIEGPGVDTDMMRTSLVLTDKLTRTSIQRFTKLLYNMSNIPYDVLRVVLQLTKEEGKETHQFLYYFYGLQDGDYRVDSTHATLRNVRHHHRRPWLLLQNLGFLEIQSNHKTHITIRDDSFKLLNNIKSTLEILWILYLEREVQI
ncbi:uncharacterized protein [Antedon mediterranea]|uniref:uncharacterized protein isoform X2 n=1 Tax=Antedon mediterranea TaxID=105859 RepID=UPI003AF89D65